MTPRQIAKIIAATHQCVETAASVEALAAALAEGRSRMDALAADRHILRSDWRVIVRSLERLARHRRIELEAQGDAR